MSERVLRIGLPILVLALVLALWEAVVRINHIPPYVLPAPGLILATLYSDGTLLMHSLWVTLVTTFEGFALAAVGGIGLAILFSQSRVVEYSLYPYAVTLQVTPVVAIAPLLLIYLPQHLDAGEVITSFEARCVSEEAWRSTPLVSALLKSYEGPLSPLLRQAQSDIYFAVVRLPDRPRLRIAGGLSLIGAVVAEIAAGSAGAGSGLAYRIAESGYRLNIPRMFAALLLLAVAGIVIYFALAALSHLALCRWHESAVRREL